MRELKFVINGEEVGSSKTFDVINPATEEVLYQCPGASKEQVDLAVQSAKKAFANWRQLTFEERSNIFQLAAKKVTENIDELAKLLSQEQGKPLAHALGEINGTAAALNTTAVFKNEPEVVTDNDKLRVEVHRKPLGVVAVITPWNYPVLLAAGRFTSALMSGNTVVLKPSPYTPLSTLLLGMLLKDVFPAGVLNVIAGGDEVGELLTNHPLVRKISFTGSVQTGKAIAKVASKDLKRVTLELGGNDAAIVLEDADVDKVGDAIFWGAFTNCGQICIAIKRLYVHEKVYEPLLAKLKDLAESVKLGDGLDPTTQLGPLNNKAQLDIVTTLVEDAKAKGATIVTGGERLNRPGYFYKPTIITNVQEGVRIVDEEQFGPALPVIKYTDINDVIARANNTTMGLGASVWGTDVSKAAQIVNQLESGVGWVNTILNLPRGAPFGGVKESGIGREFGRWSLDELTEVQTVVINKG